MKKLIVGLMAVAMLVGVSLADTKSVIVTASGAAAYSAAVPVSGWLDKIEIVKSDDNEVVDIDIGTFDGTTAIDTFVNIDALATSVDKVVVRPGAVRTSAAGVAMTAVVAVGSTTNDVTTQIVVPVERIMVGGNVLVKVNASAGTNATVKAIFYFEPTDK